VCTRRLVPAAILLLARDCTPALVTLARDCAPALHHHRAETDSIFAEIFNSNPIVFDIVVGLFGLIVGSFLNVVIYRVPAMMDREEQSWHRAWTAQNHPPAIAPETLDREQIDWVPIDPQLTDPEPVDPQPVDEEPFNLMQPGSACPKCGAPVKPYQNIPILSYLLLGGHCASCGAKISLRYPMVEGLTGIVSVLVAWHFGFSVACAGALILSWTLIALTMIDLDRQWLPDRMTLPLMWIGLGFSLLSGPDGGPLFTDPRSSIIGATAGYLSLWGVYQGFKLATGKEGMGYGDFKLLAALGAWFGWQMLLIIILIAAGVGLIAAIAMIGLRGHDRQAPIPFGPYLAIAGFVALLWGPELLNAWLGSGSPGGWPG